MHNKLSENCIVLSLMYAVQYSVFWRGLHKKRPDFTYWTTKLSVPPNWKIHFCSFQKEQPWRWGQALLFNNVNRYMDGNSSFYVYISLFPRMCLLFFLLILSCIKVRRVNRKLVPFLLFFQHPHLVSFIVACQIQMTQAPIGMAPVFSTNMRTLKKKKMF